MGMNIRGGFYFKPFTQADKDRIKNAKPEYTPQELKPQPKPEKKPSMQPLRQPITKDQEGEFIGNLDFLINNPDIPGFEQ